jgi:G3E family GTPase
VFQGVHMLLQFSSSAEGVGQPWQPDEKRVCKLVFIGRNLDRKELNEGFAACLAAGSAAGAEAQQLQQPAAVVAA